MTFQTFQPSRALRSNRVGDWTYSFICFIWKRRRGGWLLDYLTLDVPWLSIERNNKIMRGTDEISNAMATATFKRGVFKQNFAAQLLTPLSWLLIWNTFFMQSFYRIFWLLIWDTFLCASISRTNRSVAGLKFETQGNRTMVFNHTPLGTPTLAHPPVCGRCWHLQETTICALHIVQL